MGLVEEQQKMVSLEYRKAKQEAEKATKKAEELQRKLDILEEEKQNKKEYERDLKKAVENDLIRVFQNAFDMYGLEKAKIYLNLKNNHDDILNTVPESEEERDFIEKNYYKILKRVEEIYKKDNEAKKMLYTEQLAKTIEEIAEQKRQEEKKSKNILIKILKNIGYFILALFHIIWNTFIYVVVVLFALLDAAAKGK